MIVICPQCKEGREVKKKPSSTTVCRKCKNLNSRKKQDELIRHSSTCKECGKVRYFNSKSSAESFSMCRECYLKQGIKNRVRTCIDCGETKIVTTAKDAKAKRCIACSGKYKAKKNRQNKTLKRYVSYCIDCGRIKLDKIKRHSKRCITCLRNRTEINKTKVIYRYCLKEMKLMIIEPPKLRFYRICPECPEDNNTIEVSSKTNSGIKLCKKHSQLANAAKVKAKPKANKPRKYTARKTKSVSKEAIEKARQINREHREAQAKEKKIVKQRLTDEEMIEKFLINNEPSVKSNFKEPMPHTVSCGLCLETSLVHS